MKVTKMIKLRENVGVNAETQKMERINEQMKVVILQQKEKNKLTKNKDQKSQKEHKVTKTYISYLLYSISTHQQQVIVFSGSLKRYFLRMEDI